MPIEFAPASATSVALDARRALGLVQPTALPGPSVVGTSTQLPLDVLGAASASQLNPVSVSVDDATVALAVSLISGEGILDALSALAGAIQTAAHTSLVSPSTALQPGGTRISRINIQTDGRRLLEAINSLVDQSEYAGANFISSDAGRIAVQTTRYGGSILVTPQPLDTRGLGLGAPDIFGRLTSFNALSDADVTDLTAAVNNAIVLAGNRIQNLQVLERGLGFNTAALQDFARVLSQGRSDVLPPGSAINLIG